MPAGTQRLVPLSMRALAQKTLHCPLWQIVPWPQTVPHAPQLLLSVLRFVSQPLPPLLSQLPNPALHVPTPQIPLPQPGVPLATAPHTLAHAPQLFTSVRIAISQPSAADWLQSARPALQ